ncbi:MAG: hypothetical protein CVU60_03080 [Deltaproteobacteria bacterium HGW-Deltaproteobacteria-18]|nr:MAG: hypothetical protein CVU60_03080 [Deltaproteobacteria bacterium HGW-Deltaproteobacteria-18]
MIPSVTSFTAFFGFDRDISDTNQHRFGLNEHIFGITKHALLACFVLSLLLHALGCWVADLRPVQDLIQDRLILLDIVVPPLPPSIEPVAAPVPVQAPVAETASPVPPSDIKTSTPVSPDHEVKNPAPEKTMPKKKAPAVKPESRVSEVVVPESAHNAVPVSRQEIESEVPIGRIVPREGVTVLANESGQDALKHGAEARFMHGVATEEFVEENYIGEYSLGKAGKVWIEDDRAGSGHLILHAEAMGLRRPLFRFNRFIYVYGKSPDSPEPILGSVTFFSDGYHIHQFLWQHNSTHAYFPRRD